MTAAAVAQVIVLSELGVGIAYFGSLAIRASWRTREAARIR